MSASTRGRVDWLWALVGLGFGVLGLVFALLFRERPVAASRTGTAPAVVSDAALLQLVEEVRLLREAIERHPPLASGAAAPRLPVAEGVDPAAAVLMTKWFAELDQRLALLTSITGPGGTAAPAVELPATDFQPVPFPAREEVSTREFSKRHIFWSYQQVVDAYGVPDGISTNPHGSQIWVYNDGDANLEFVFRDGFVLRVEW